MLATGSDAGVRSTADVEVTLALSGTCTRSVGVSPEPDANATVATTARATNMTTPKPTSTRLVRESGGCRAYATPAPSLGAGRVSPLPNSSESRSTGSAREGGGVSGPPSAPSNSAWVEIVEVATRIVGHVDYEPAVTRMP
jgi:hypothetical protein